MKREDLRPYLQREIEKWSGKSYETLRAELKAGNGNYADCDPEKEYHLEVDLIEDRDDYVHVAVSVCSEKVRWSCFHPLSRNFLVYRDGSVKK